jgi:predicted DsbA family dithiol-disulfide isomerase
MKRLCVTVAFMAIVLSACTRNCPPCGGGEGIAAVVNGEPITMAELNAAAGSRLVRIDTEIYQTKKRVLDRLVEEKLIAEAARKKGMNPDQYMTAEVTSKAKVPADDEVKALYDARKGAIDKPFDAVKDQIASYLMQNRVAEVRMELLSNLRRAGEVELKLSPPRASINIQGAPTLGDADAGVTIIEFSDYQCPECKRVRQTIWKVLDDYKGKVRYVFMDSPLSFHRDARKAHEAAHCAGDQGKYFEYHRTLFEHQTALSIDDLKKYARKLGLDEARFDACLDAGEQAAAVVAMIEEGSKAGVTGTPAFFINGIMISGARPYGSFKEIIDMELDR